MDSVKPDASVPLGGCEADSDPPVALDSETGDAINNVKRKNQNYSSSMASPGGGGGGAAASAGAVVVVDLERLFSDYFCIFCKDTFDNINDAYLHYKNHMSLGVFCRICDGNMCKGTTAVEICEIDHDTEEIVERLDTERTFSSMWIERFLTYQEELMEKSHFNIITDNKFVLGCPVCDYLVKACGVRIPNEALAKQQELAEALSTNASASAGAVHDESGLGSPGSSNGNTNHSNGSNSTSNTTTGNNNSNTKEAVKDHTLRHACVHLRYYPYECQACEDNGRYQKRPDMCEMTRHIKENHSQLLEGKHRRSIKSIIKPVTITKLEEFLDEVRKTSPMVRFEPIIPESSLMASTTNRVDPLKIRRNPQTGDRAVVKGSSLPPPPELKPASITILTNSSPHSNHSTILASTLANRTPTTTYHTSPGSNSSVLTLRSNSHLVRANNHSLAASPLPPPLTISNLAAAASSSLLLSSSSSSAGKTEDRPTGASVILKSKSNLLMGNNSCAQSSQSSFEEQFGNIFDDDMVIKFPVKPEEGLNVEYFCIFCDSVFKDKDIARRHYQIHVNYYPMMCSLCGEGATDMQEFLKHHTEVHPDAEKGRYKRRENPVVDKWINGFLYAQATVIKSFPCREMCPVCEKVFSQEEIRSTKVRRSTINRKIDHVHRHLCYLPYECTKCKEEGKEFPVAYFESKAHSHIKLKHPEEDASDDRWMIFKKTVSIPKLDEFITNYLAKFNISMEYERRPMKKQFRDTYSSPDYLSAYGHSLNCGDQGSASDSESGHHPSAAVAVSTSSTGTMVVISTQSSSFSSSNQDGGGHASSRTVFLNSIYDQGPSGLQNSSEDVDSIVVSISPTDAGYLRHGDDPISDHDYFCIFCPLRLPSKIEAYPHYSQHLEYTPVVCKLCKARFHDMDHYTAHHQQYHPERCDLHYEIHEDENIEKWVDEFLDTQQGNHARNLVLNCSCGMSCPTCEKLTGPSSVRQCTIHNDVDFSNHIHQHLNYQPYECTLCKKSNRICRVPNLDSLASSHVRAYHSLRDASTATLSRIFPKTMVIPRLEKFIAESVLKRRSFDRRYKLCGQTISSAIGCTIGTNGVVRTEHANGNMGYKVGLHQANLGLKVGVAHVRVEGGRVVNLPSSSVIRMHQQQQKMQQHQQQTQQLYQPPPLFHKSLDLHRHTLRLESGVETQFSPGGTSVRIGSVGSGVSHVVSPSVASGARGGGTGNGSALPGHGFYVKCLHCNMELPSRRQLKLHHNQEHPGLSMACFTTPKSMLSLGST